LGKSYERVDIKSDFPIFKISQRVFRLDDFKQNIDIDFLENFCEILDMGQKFIPSLFLNLKDFFMYFLSNLDISFTKLNNNIFYSKTKEKNENKKKKSEDRLTTTRAQNPIDEILSKLRKSKSNHSVERTIPLQEETIQLRNEVLSKLTENNKFKLKNNITSNQIACVKKYLKEKPFELCNSDKNVGWVLLDREMYLKLAYKHLEENPNVYVKLDRNPLSEVILTIQKTLSYLKDHGHISDRLFKNLIPIENKLGKFKILAKIHKDKFSVRPIINNIDHPTSLLSQFIDLVFQPFVKNSSSYLKDSQHLLQECESLYIDKKWNKYSCDFESLYTNIDIDTAVDKITNYLSDKISSFDYNIVALNGILKLILKNNIFIFEKNYYVQKNGIAMGSKCGPMFANLYIYILEKNWINIYKPVIYKRFIDDIFIISQFDLLNSNFVNNFDNLKLNIVKDKEVQFLDLKISDDKLFNKLDFDLYVKPTNTFQYLLQGSNHPTYIFKNIPKSVFIRFRRICSKYSNYLYNSRVVIPNLIKRGYINTELIKMCMIFSKVNRKLILPYKENKVNEKFICKNFKFIMNYDLNYINFNFDFNFCIKYIKDKFTWMKSYEFNFINKTNDNFGHIFINCKNYNFKSSSLKTSKCNNLCITCDYKYNFSYIKLNTFLFPSLSINNCFSLNCIYIIICTKCDAYYIGQTSDFKARLSQHLSSIRRFEAYTKYTSEVGAHFSRNHILKEDLKFIIFKENVSDLFDRLNIENDVINLFLNFKKHVINKFIPNHKFIKKFCFI
jgi:hypothetical protein